MGGQGAGEGVAVGPGTTTGDVAKVAKRKNIIDPNKKRKKKKKNAPVMPDVEGGKPFGK